MKRTPCALAAAAGPIHMSPVSAHERPGEAQSGSELRKEPAFLKRFFSSSKISLI
jgi:hypothetical protein